MTKTHHKQFGFSLLELMIVVAVIAILAAIAVPSYRSYVLRTNRSEAKIALLSIQIAEEKWFLQNSTYTTLGNLGIAATTPKGYYAIDFSVTPTTTAYTARATASAGQTADIAACQVFTIDQSGNKMPSESTGCWR